jgi:DNA polymerase type B, organellar and viral
MENYVDFLYNLRSEYPSGHPLNLIAKLLLNSLYGRFGMDDNFVNIDVIHKDYYSDFENKFLDNITEIIDLGDYKIVFYNSEESNEDIGTHNVSISIAAAITAYARIHMSQFKNNPQINLYYTDTDSIYTDSEIDSNLIDNKILGKLKLENTCRKAIFLTPKVYCLVTESGKTIYKVKGLSHSIELTFNDFKQLLFKESLLQKLQTKWIKNLEEGNISVIKQLYTLKVTNNKRKLVYDENDKLIGTVPYIINENKEILNK